MFRPLALCGLLALAACAPGSPECLRASEALGKAASAVTTAEATVAALLEADLIDADAVEDAQARVADARRLLSIAQIAHAAACGAN